MSQRFERLLICGSRPPKDFSTARQSPFASMLDDVRAFVASLPKNTLVISGMAKGVDRVAQDEAIKQGLLVAEVPVPTSFWTRYGRGIGVQRDRAMVELSERVVAFWFDKSAGTGHTIRIAQELGRPVDVREYR